MPIKLTLVDGLHISDRYNQVWSRLEQVEEKTAFAHMFVKRLSRKNMVLPTALKDNALTIAIPTRLSNGSIMNVRHNLTVSAQDHLVVSEALHQLAMLDDDTDYLRTWSALNVLVKWAIKGKGDPASYFADNGESTVIATGGFCTLVFESCNEDEGGTGGSGNDGNWGSDVRDGRDAENDICQFNFDCFAYIYDNEDYDEKCVGIEYDDGTIVDGLYCEPTESKP
ncbi:MAG: hypothetical protein HRT35_25395 [Algicola sp.]|nr:hypothetical protein [Algicola sp.]